MAKSVCCKREKKFLKTWFIQQPQEVYEANKDATSHTRTVGCARNCKRY
jgi:hypothetical protein